MPVPKVIIPKSLPALNKKICAAGKADLNKPENAYQYAVLLEAFIDREMETLKEYLTNEVKDHSAVEGLIERYKPLKAKYRKAVEYYKTLLTNG